MLILLKGIEKRDIIMTGESIKYQRSEIRDRRSKIRGKVVFARSDSDVAISSGFIVRMIDDN